MVIVNDLTCDRRGEAFVKAKGGCFSIDATKDRLPVAKATMLQLARTATSRV